MLCIVGGACYVCPDAFLVIKRVPFLRRNARRCLQPFLLRMLLKLHSVFQQLHGAV